MRTDPGGKPSRGPGRPRSARAHHAILQATLELLSAEGFRGLTIEAVAARAGVAKTTIYRWWPSKLALVREALWRMAQPVPVPDTGNVREDAVTVLRALIELASDPRVVRISADALVEALRNPELEDARPSLVAARRAPLQAALQRGVSRGELPEDLELDLTIDLLTAPIVLRALVTRDPLEPGLAERIVDRVLAGLGAAAADAAASPTDRGRAGEPQAPSTSRPHDLTQTGEA